jgi:cyclic pyranopterin phosphate synthase
MMAEEGLTHLDESGAARMVDVGAKPDTERVAIAGGINCQRERSALIQVKDASDPNHDPYATISTT